MKHSSDLLNSTLQSLFVRSVHVEHQPIHLLQNFLLFEPLVAETWPQLGRWVKNKNAPNANYKFPNVNSFDCKRNLKNSQQLMCLGYLPVFPLLCTVLDSAIGLSQPSSCRFWYCARTWVKVSSMSTGDCLALLHDGYLFPQFRWFRVPACKTDTEMSSRVPSPPKTTLRLIRILL